MLTTTASYNGATYDSAREALGAAWKAENPEVVWACFKCGKKWRLLQADGSMSLTCPNCGAETSEETARGALRYFNERIEAGQAEERKLLATECAKAAAENAKKHNSAPPGLDDVIGNADAVMQIRTALQAHIARATEPNAPKWLAFPHLLLSSPGGCGKTMLAEIVAREIGAKMHLQMGQTLNSPAKVGDVLLSLAPGDVLFIEEVHGLKTPCQESLYRAMEGGVLVPMTAAGRHVGKPIALPPFTLIAATTDEWGLLPSLCQRFKYRVRLQRLTAAELADALEQRVKRAGIMADRQAVELIGQRALGTPRLAVGLLDGCIDVALAQGTREITAEVVRRTCGIWGIDSRGLDKVARSYLGFLRDAGGGPVRLNVLAARLDGLSRRTVETKVEPDLVFLGLITKTEQGRTLAAAGREHLKAV